MEPDGRSIHDLVHSRILKSLVALVSRHDPKLLLRLEADIGHFVSRLPPDKQGVAMACFSSFMCGVVSEDFRAGEESLLEGAPDWIKQWLDTPHVGNGSSSLSFEIIAREAKWRVTLEGKLYGEFASRADAVQAVTGAVDMIQQAGGDADWFDALN